MFTRRSPEARTAEVLVESSQHLAQVLDKKGSYIVPRRRRDPLVVAGGNGGLVLSRYGIDLLERPYAEQLWLPSIKPEDMVNGAIYGWMLTNRDEHQLRFEGPEMLDREMAAGLIYDLPGYVQRARIGFILPRAARLQYEPSQLAVPTLASIDQQTHPVPQAAQ